MITPRPLPIRSVALVALVALAGLWIAAPAAAQEDNLQLEFAGLEDLGPGWAYEGWLIVDGQPVSTGVFTIDAAGTPSATTFAVAQDDLDNTSLFVLTIEPSPDPDPAPSAVHVLGGDWVDGVAQLTVGHATALGTDFADASGSYILNTPSSSTDDDYANGIWWLDPEAGPGTSLVLPALPAGWVYEGWVAGAEGPISTGRFASASGEDSDGAGPAAGPEPFPPFPGQDYVDPARVLTSGYAAVISVEPEPDNAAGPFALKPLVDESIEDVGIGVLQAMAYNPASLPTGKAMAAGMDDMAMDDTEMESPETLPTTGGVSGLAPLALAAIAGGLLVVGAGLALGFALGRR